MEGVVLPETEASLLGEAFSDNLIAVGRGTLLEEALSDNMPAVGRGTCWSCVKTR